MTRLSQWLVEQPESTVAKRFSAELSAQQFIQRVRAWKLALEARPGTRWAVYHSDSFEFLAILMALWQLRRTACISGDNLPATQVRQGENVDAFIGEFDAAEILPLEQEVVNRPAADWIVPAADFIAVEMSTSGSTGEARAITKTIAQLESEIEMLEALWPSRPGTVVLTTVSHQHFYGLIFALLWPFCSRRVFEAVACEFPEDILYRAGHCEGFALVSSPSHLGRLNSEKDWASIAARCDFVVSSAAPLQRKHSLTAGRLLQTSVREIYGSTETGAIAWRIQQESDNDALWQAMPGVVLDLNDAAELMVDSPLLAEAGQYLLPDRVEFDEQGRFKLLGRADRIVKVEGKRVSLSAIEQILASHERVVELRALTIERARMETAVVMQLDSQGQQLLLEDGRKKLIQGFKQLLAKHFEAIVIPRRWRFVEEMPYNRQGKLPLQNLQALFQQGPGEPSLPKIINQQAGDDELHLTCHIPANLIYFDGHMPECPILPGIVQVHWATQFARRWLSVKGRFSHLEAVKFQQVILPHYQISLSLKYNRLNDKLSFKIESDKGVHSSGRICFN